MRTTSVVVRSVAALGAVFMGLAMAAVLLRSGAAVLAAVIDWTVR